MKVRIPLIDYTFNIPIAPVDNYQKAKRINQRAQNKIKKIKKDIRNARKEASNSLKKYGKKKISIYDTSIRNFVIMFSQIKDVDLKKIRSDEKTIDKKLSVIRLRQVDLEAIDGIKTLIAGGGAGAATGAIAYGAVGTLAAASTGTAISSLSGIAASNATLAWLGGGSLASGGLGVAGGTLILGGLVAVPILVVGGFIANAQSKVALESAKENSAIARKFAKEAEVAVSVLELIIERTYQLGKILDRLQKIFDQQLVQLNSVLEKYSETSIEQANGIQSKKRTLTKHNTLRKPKVSYNSLSLSEKKELMVIVAMAQTIKNIMDTNIFDKKGKVTKESKVILTESGKFLQNYNA